MAGHASHALAEPDSLVSGPILPRGSLGSGGMVSQGALPSIGE